jgi:riboflavin kinase
MRMANTGLSLREMQVLKQLALMGAIGDTVDVTSAAIADSLGITQQTASLQMLRLVEKGYVTRRMRSRRQGIAMTPKGVEALRREYSDYIRMFDSPKRLSMKGIVTSGLGEGKYYMSQPEYKRQFRERLRFEPYEGTFNLSLPESEANKLQILREAGGMAIDGFRKGGRTFGSSKCFRASLKGLECAVVVPFRTHYSDTLEIICKDNIRNKLRFKDGDKVEIQIML